MDTGEKMYSRNLLTQKVEAKITCLVLNKMTDIGMPMIRQQGDL